MSAVVIGAPIYSDVGVLYTPAFDISGAWKGTLPIANLQDRALHKVARTESDDPADTRGAIDLGVDRAVRVIAFPKHTLSSAGKWRAIGRPSTLAFAYTAGEDIFARGGVYARVPTANVKAASYVDAAGVLRYAGENRVTYSEQFDNAAWVKTTTTIAANSVAGPNGATVADTLTATAANATTIQDLGVLTSTAFTYSIWLKRLTGTGNIQLTLDNGGTWTTVAVTSDWVRYSLTQTVANPDCGVRIVTNADAVYAWGAQVNMGSTADPYVPTTTAACGAPRDNHWISSARTLLLEAAGTNLCLQSENFGVTWAAMGTPTRVASAHTASGVTLDLLGDDDAAAGEGYQQAVTFTADAVKAVSIFVKEGSATTSFIQVWDNTAAANRLAAVLTWSGGLPSVTASVGTYIGYDTLADGVFRLLFATTSVTAANTNSLRVYPATTAALAVANTGTLYVGGVQAENALVPSSYIPTTTATVTRAADSLYFPYTTTPQAMTVYCKSVNVGQYVNTGATRRIVHIGSATVTADPRFSVYGGGGATVSSQYDDATTSVASSTALTAVLGDVIEQRATLNSDWTTTVGVSKNGAAETTNTSAASGASVAWAAERLYLTGGLSGENTSCAYSKITVDTGVETLATMQAAVSDSGWINAWPSGATAETLDNLNYGLIKVLTTAFTARYWSFQLHDPDNTAAVLDVARLIVAGGYEPSVNFSAGATFETESDSVTTYADGGNAIHDERPMRRVARFTVENVTESETWLTAWRTMKQVGPKGQCFLVLNPDADAFTMVETAFLCVPREQTRIEYPYALYRNLAFAFTEEL